MPLPPEFDTVTVTGKFVTLTGDPIVGKIKFTASPKALISDLTDTVLVPVVVEVDLDVNGSFSAELPATTDPDINPQGWTYEVVESFAGGRTYNVDLPFGGGPYDLSEVAPVPSSDGEAIVRGPGVAAGGTTGQVLAKASDTDYDTQWVTGGGGTGVTDHGLLTGLADDDHPQYHTDARGDARYYQKGETDAAIAAHHADTTDVHGIPDTANLIVEGDPRLTDARPPTAHGHAITDVTGLATVLDGKADDAHSHAIGDVTGLQTALDGKADDADVAALDGRLDTLEAHFPIRAVQATPPNTTGWTANQFWYDTSTEA